jgi:tol-pal system protein YbgF
MLSFRPFRAGGAALFAVAVLVAAAAPASAQSESEMRALTQKVDRLQRELNTLQRQVYAGEDGQPGSAAVGGSDGGDAGGGTLTQAAAARLNSRLNALEEQMQQLTGMLEETRFQVRQMRQRMDTLSKDVDYRLSQLEQGTATGAAAGQSADGDAQRPAGQSDAGQQEGGQQQGGQQQAAQQQGGQQQGDRQQASPVQSGQQQTGDPAADQAAASAGDGRSPQSLGQVSQSTVEELREQQAEASGARGGGQDGGREGGQNGGQNGGQSADGQGQAGGTQTASTPPADYELPDGSPAEQYEHAFGLLRQADYGEAERALAAFLAAHPEHELAGNAKYWLGETYYVRGDYSQAAVTFAEGFQNYGDSTKAPDNLLKLGMSLARLDRDADACGIFAELRNRFPDAPNNILQRAQRERDRLGCGG